MAKPNYSFEKRQRELAKKKKKEEKMKERAGRKTGSDADGAEANEPMEGHGSASPLTGVKAESTS